MQLVRYMAKQVYIFANLMEKAKTCTLRKQIRVLGVPPDAGLGVDSHLY